MKGSLTDQVDLAVESLWKLRFSDSEAIAARAATLLKKAEKARYQRGSANAKLTIAAANFYMSDNKTALRYLTEALHYFEKNKQDKGYIRALLIKGNIFESLGDYENTLKLWHLALKASFEINDIESQGESCNQLGLIYTRLCNFPKALEFYNKGLKIREELGDENGAASSLNRIGMVLRQMKNYGASLENYLLSLEIRRRNNQNSAIPWTLLGIASTYEDMKEFEMALRYYEQGMLNGDKRCSMQCHMGAGRVYSKTGDTSKAEGLLSIALNMAKELKSLALIAEASSALSAHYEKYSRPDKALKYFKLHLKAKESYQSTEVQSRMSNFEVAHAIEKSEQEKEIYRLRHVELKAAYDIIEENNRNITASISYASRIQKALLPSVKEINGLEKKLFVIYLPKDIVSGDFYWFTEIRNKLILVAADCTGHGVPGALMSMLGISFLEEIIKNREITDSATILDELSREVRRALHQKGDINETKDGMDIALCIIDSSERTIQYSGAHNNLYLVRNNDLTEYDADRMPVGYYDGSGKKFTSHVIKYKTGDLIYLFSDGYMDQFGGPKNKRMKSTLFREIILKYHKKPLAGQKQNLEAEFNRWKASNTQTDDVLVIGFRL
jgi:serine phosphatase RsbU (regulator of sigma subunit)